MFNNRAQRRKVSDSSAESNTNKFIGSPEDIPSNRIDNGPSTSQSTFSMVSNSGVQTPTVPSKFSHRPQQSFNQEVNYILFLLTFKFLLNN